MLDFAQDRYVQVPPDYLKVGLSLVKGVTLWLQSHFSMTRPYQHVKRDISIPINQDGQCVVVKDLHTDDKGACAQRKKWSALVSVNPILTQRFMPFSP